MDEICNGYFDWLCDLVTYDRPSMKKTYRKLLVFLHDHSFRYSIPRDGNRYEDGINMRYLYGVNNNVSQRDIARELDGKPCSILEMMVALSHRCESELMSNDDYGDRTGQWFWGMVNNLGLGEMNNNNFDDHYCQYVINRFLDREYAPNGAGGLFTVDVNNGINYFVDLRNYEIWYQATWYFNNVIEGGE